MATPKEVLLLGPWQVRRYAALQCGALAFQTETSRRWQRLANSQPQDSHAKRPALYAWCYSSSHVIKYASNAPRRLRRRWRQGRFAHPRCGPAIETGGPQCGRWRGQTVSDASLYSRDRSSSTVCPSVLISPDVRKGSPAGARRDRLIDNHAHPWEIDSLHTSSLEERSKSARTYSFACECTTTR